MTDAPATTPNRVRPSEDVDTKLRGAARFGNDAVDTKSTQLATFGNDSEDVGTKVTGVMPPDA
jgi:hypothetical protein